MRYVFAGGGTGGHLFPGISLAQVISRKDRFAEIVFVGAKKDFEKEQVEKCGFRYRCIRQKPFAHTLFEFVAFSFWAGIAFFVSLALFFSLKPDVAIGLGGYGSVMPLILARLLKVPIVLLEQNSIPGKANLFLSRWAHLVCVQYESSKNYFAQCARVEKLGNPIREAILKEARKIKSFTLDKGKRTILILGGSQGASPINEKVISELEVVGRVSDRIQIIHQTGENDFEKVSSAYAKTPIKAYVLEFIDEMAPVYQSADLVISRSGATTIAEMTALGLPSILIPFPHAKDNHQFFNAQEIADKGAAVLFEQKNFASRSLMKEALDIIFNEKRLDEMKGASAKLAVPRAAEIIADEIIALAQKG